MNFLKSSIGQKVLMALTGLGLVGFLVAHMAGNLLVFQGPDGINEYARWLHSRPGLLWVARAGLIAMFLVHVATALNLTRQNMAARPKNYKVNTVIQATLSSRLMRLTGVVVLFYVIGHLLHFTWGQLYPEHQGLTDAAGRIDVYTMVVLGFQQPGVALAYIVSLLCLASHLNHGIQSVFQTLGLTNEKYQLAIGHGSKALTAVIIIGYISIPLAVMLGKLTVPFGG